MIRKIAIVIVLLVVVITTTAGACGIDYSEARKACLRAGYSEVRGEKGSYFCYRMVDATEEVVPVEDVME